MTAFEAIEPEDEHHWAILVLIKNAWKHGREFVLLKAMIVLVAIVVTACGDDVPPPCPDVGCPAGSFLPCRGLDGPCQCKQDDGEKIECMPVRKD